MDAKTHTATDGVVKIGLTDQMSSVSSALQRLEDTEKEVMKLMQIGKSTADELSKAPDCDIQCVRALTTEYFETAQTIKTSLSECVDSMATK